MNVCEICLFFLLMITKINEYEQTRFDDRQDGVLPEYRGFGDGGGAARPPPRPRHHQRSRQEAIDLQLLRFLFRHSFQFQSHSHSQSSSRCPILYHHHRCCATTDICTDIGADVISNSHFFVRQSMLDRSLASSHQHELCGIEHRWIPCHSPSCDDFGDELGIGVWRRWQCSCSCSSRWCQHSTSIADHFASSHHREPQRQQRWHQQCGLPLASRINTEELVRFCVRLALSPSPK